MADFEQFVTDRSNEPMNSLEEFQSMLYELGYLK